MKDLIRTFARVTFPVLALVAITACGGGSSPPPPPPPPSIVIAATPAPPSGTVTYPYPAFGFSASGGLAPYTWQATGTVPPGLAVGPDGTVSGTPTTAGSFSFSVTATDSAQTPVNGPPLMTQIMISAPGPLVFNATPAPPGAAAGVVYPAYTFSTTGGNLPFKWSITAGNLPPGLTLGSSDGSLSGAPTQVGSFTFTVTVTDSAPTPSTSSLAFTINLIPPPPPSIANSEAPTGTVGVDYGPFQLSTNGGLAPFVWTETGALDGLTLSSSGVLSGTPSAAGKFPITLEVTDALNRTTPSVPLIVRVSLARSGAFTLTTGNLAFPRSGHSATLLNTGKVLIAGGANGAADRSAELYDPATEMFTATGSMTAARIGHSATLLNLSTVPNFGKVLIVGPVGSTAELYDPAAGTFTATGSMTQARTSPTVTLLEGGSARLGSALIVGGNSVAGDLTAELYNPATGTFNATGSTSILRAGHTANQLLDGRVLIAGGGTQTAELYDPTSGTFTPTGSMTSVRTGATATRLQDGSVLIFGGGVGAELYNANAGTFAPVAYIQFFPRGQTASLRHDGSVLVAGGYQCGRGCSSSYYAVLFGPESDGFTATGSLNTARDGHTATELSDGTVLIVGGNHRIRVGCGYWCTKTQISILSSAELFK